MTLRKWMIIGFVATVFIAVALPVYAFNESYRMVNAQTTLLTESIEHGEIIYAESCVVCHGVDGRGIGAYPGLDRPGFLSRIDSVFSNCSVCPIAYHVYERVKREVREREGIQPER